MNTEKPVFNVTNAIRDFMRLESAGGLILLAAAILALLVANSPLSALYASFLDTPIGVRVGALAIDKPLILWVNDGLMAIFFFLIGLEIKREVIEGELSSISQVVLPGVGALGGMLVPAGIYLWINAGDADAVNGWAIPVATDIAFALALLSVFGKRVPIGLKVFLLTLAIFDDLAAIIIIAVFYSGDISILALTIGAAILILAIILNRIGVSRTSAYVLLGIALWVAMLKSDVHATSAGVLIAFCVPIRDQKGDSPLREMEHDLHGPVAFAILPIFAFANAGLALGGIALSDLTSPITLGVILGLVAGKPIGILLFVGLAVMLKLARLPLNVNWPQVLGVAFACGIGFTMSLFIAGLAFTPSADGGISGDRLGVLVGSIASAIAAYVILRFSLPKTAPD
ncbi:MAG: Na+/H+ antiporter NhaA [Pseudomonadota bacterium]